MNANIIKSNNFKDHLEFIRKAKQKTDAVLDITNPGHHEAEATLALAWEALFDHFCYKQSFDLPELNTISAIIHKLTSAYNQVKSLELKTREALLKEKENQEKEALTTVTLPRKALPKAVLNSIEEQLNLL